jgi:hypothetical protein
LKEDAEEGVNISVITNIVKELKELCNETISQMRLISMLYSALTGTGNPNPFNACYTPPPPPPPPGVNPYAFGMPPPFKPFGFDTPGGYPDPSKMNPFSDKSTS